MIPDELWENVGKHVRVCMNGAVVKLDVAVWAHADDIARMVRTIVRSAQRFDVVSLRVWRTVTKHEADQTNLARKVSVCFDAAGERGVT